jgi:RimJ/RimL family protein N-acetyltransferase
VQVPIVETERLTLRAHRPDDFADSLAMWSDPAVTRYIGGKPSTGQQTWMRMLNYRGLWSFLDFGYWAIEEKASGAFAGDIGFADFHRDITPSMRAVPELGWALATPFHGRGYATEAARAAIGWMDTRFGLKRTVCMIDEANTPSVNVAKKCGYSEFERTLFNGAPIVFLQRGS